MFTLLPITFDSFYSSEVLDASSLANSKAEKNEREESEREKLERERERKILRERMRSEE